MAEMMSVVLSFLKAIGKYRWHAVIIAWFAAVLGWGVVYSLPDQYQASARVYVDTQSVLKPLLAGMTTLPNVDQQVAFMRRTLISRPNVEKVMREVDLDLRNKTPKEHEAKVDELMAAIKMAGTERDDIYTITYTNANPKLAKDIVQSLLTMFVEGSFGGKRGDSEKAVAFIDEQIKSYETRLSDAENNLKEFKIKNMGMLPRSGGGDYTSQIANATDQLSQARLELMEAEQARNALRRQMGASAMGSGKPAEIPYSNPELDSRIAVVNKNLDSLRMQFTEEHPDIAGAKRLLAQLEEKRREEAKNYKPSLDPGAALNPMQQQVSMSLSAAETRVASLQARVSEYTSRLARLQSQSTAAPDVEAQLAQLNRDYEVNRSNYQKLVERRESAKLSGELSSATDMMTFRVIDPPTAPRKPIGPNRPQLMSVVFAAALALGLGAALLMSQFRPTFLSQSALRESTGLPVLGTISMNWTAEQQSRHKKRRYALWASIVSLFGVYGAAMAAVLVKASA